MKIFFQEDIRDMLNSISQANKESYQQIITPEALAFQAGFTTALDCIALAFVLRELKPAKPKQLPQ